MAGLNGTMIQRQAETVRHTTLEKRAVLALARNMLVVVDVSPRFEAAL
jgi:hypothetical protein